jgi:F0F1-type ATP synthase membrane subunit b/b'
MSLIVDEKNDWIEGKLKEARIQSTLLKEKSIRESEKAREKNILDKRNELKKDFDNKMKQLEKIKIESEKELQLKVETFTRQIKEKLL